MAYQQQPEMQYSQHPQQIPAEMLGSPPGMQQPPNQGQYYQPPTNCPPPPMRIDGTVIYNSHTDQPIYTYTISQAPGSDLQNSLVTLRYAPTGVTIGNVRRGAKYNASTCWGMCGCLSPDLEEDVVTVGLQGEKAVINDLGAVKSCWAWKPTWAKHGGPEEWAFFESAGFGGGMVLRDAVANGNDIMRVEGGGDIKFTDAGLSLTEDMVGEIILVLASLRVNDDDVKQSWLWELICWGP